MALVRVTVAGTIGKAVRINPDATEGSKIGVDFQLPDGTVPSLEGLADALYTAAPPAQFFDDESNDPTRNQIYESDIIDGLLLARVADPEVITGAYTFNANVTFGNAVPINWKDSGGTKFEFLNFTAGTPVSNAVGHIVSKLGAGVTTTSGTYVSAAGASVAFASMDANEDYVVFIRAYVGNSSSTTTNQNKVRLAKGGVEVVGSELVYESPATVLDSHGVTYSWGGIIASGSSGDLQLQHLSGNGSDTVFVNNVTILMIKVSDLILNTNVFHDTNTGLVELDDGDFPAAWMATGAAVTIGDGVSDYLVFGSVRVDNFLTGGNTVDTRINDGTVQLKGTGIVLGDFSDELTLGFFQLWQAPAASTTLSVEAQTTGFPVDKVYASIIAIRMDAFSDYNSDLLATSPDLGNGPNTLATVAFTTAATGEYGFISGATGPNLSVVGPPDFIRNSLNGGGDVTIGGSETQLGAVNVGSLDQVHIGVSADQSLSISDTIDADFVANDAATPAVYTNNFLLVFEWSIATAPEVYKVGNAGFATEILGTTVTVQAPLFATSYDGVLAANLTDKTDTEVIETFWTWSGTQAKIRFNQTDAAADNRLWELGVGNERFALTLRNDAGTQIVDIIKIERTGNTGDSIELIVNNLIAGTVDADFDDLTATSYGGILEANLLDKSTAETVAGLWTFSGAQITRFVGTAPRIRIIETGGTLNEGAWQFLANTDQFLFSTLADDETGGNSIMLVTRTATVVDAVQFFAPLKATSYDGILAANLLDKTATEDITGSYTFSVGPTFFSAGTEGAPGIAFNGDPDTGAYSPGANIFAITVGGVEAVRWTGASIPIVDYALDSGIIASTTQTQGQQLLTASYNEISTVANDNDVVTLPTCKKGRYCLVINTGANKLQLFPSSGDNLGQGIDSSTTVEPNSALLFIGSDPTNWREADNNKTYRIGHTYGVISKIKVPNGDKDFIIPFFVSLASGQTAKLVKVRHKINAGTSVTCKLQKNGSDITGFTGISVTTTAADTDPADVTLANNDKLALVVTGTSGNPQNMSFTIFIEYTT